MTERAPWLKWLLLALWLPLMLVTAVAPIGGPIMLERRDGAIDPFARIGLIPFVDFLKPFSAEALRSGLRKGDRIVAVDGRALSGGGTVGPNEELGGLIAGPSDGTPVTLTTRSADGSTHVHRLTRTDAHIEGYFRAGGISLSAANGFAHLMDFFTNCVVLAAAVLLFVRGGRRGVPTLLAFALPLMSLTICGSSLMDATGLVWLRLTTQVIAVSFLILAVMLFPDGSYYPRWTRWIGLLVIALAPVGAIALAMGLISAFTWIPFHTAILLIAAATLVQRFRHLATETERQQIRWATFGFGFAVIFFVASQILDQGVMPRDIAPSTFVWAATLDNLLVRLFFLALASGLIVSLLRFRLYDAEAVIVRSVSFGALALVLVALFAGSEKVIELLGEEYFGEKLGVLAGGIGAAFAALMIVPLHHRLTHWAEHKFQKQLIHLKTGLPLLVGDMRETAPVVRIAAATLDSVSHGVRASRAALVFEGALLDARGIEADEVEHWRHGWSPALHESFDIDRADPMFPLRVPLAADGHGRIGWLLLGPRPDGSFYGKDERETLDHIADPVARALEIAAAREKREADERERWRDQEGLNAEIRAVNSQLLSTNSQLLRTSEETVRVLSEIALKLDRAFARQDMAAK